MMVPHSQVSSAPPARASSERLLYLQAPGLVRPQVVDRLGGLGLDVTVATDSAEALRRVAADGYRCCVVDLGHERTALTAIRLLRARHAALPLVGLFDPAHPSLAAEAVQMGLADVLSWPFQPVELASVLSAIQDRAAAAESGVADAGARDTSASATVQALLCSARAALERREGIALVGERGSGRTTLARRAYELAGGHPERLVVIDCGQPPEGGLERALFGGGNQAGDSPTGQAPERLPEHAALWRARGGVLLLARLPEAPARVQARLARVLRDRAVLDPAGLHAHLDVCLVAVIEAPLLALQQDGRVRYDLGDRMPVTLAVPALRDRREDIPMLAVQLLRTSSAELGKARVFSRSALTLLAAMPWPGNVQELHSLVERVGRTVKGSVVQLEDVLAHARLDGFATQIDTGDTLRDARQRFEREWISAMLIRHHGRVGEAAKALGIQRTNLYRKVRQLRIERALVSPRRA